MTAFSVEDRRFMDVALAQAYGALGSTAPNPAVGCVVVQDGQVIAATATAPGGRPHAEPQALSQAGAAAEGADIYVSLEPCSHYGQTPPCADALIAARPGAVIVACQDPFAEVDGRGLARLTNAAIPVRLGVREAEAIALNAGFFTVLRDKKAVAIDDERSALIDAELEQLKGESEADALARAADQGLTRVRLVNPLATGR